MNRPLEAAFYVFDAAPQTRLKLSLVDLLENTLYKLALDSTCLNHFFSLNKRSMSVLHVTVLRGRGIPCREFLTDKEAFGKFGAAW